MIYLISSAAFKEGSDSELEIILKIGYTGENGNKSRFDTYITENPTMKVLYLISGGDQEHEKLLHKKFKKYLKYGHEWFSNESEILEFFKTHTTKEIKTKNNYLKWS